jgi:3'-phosphoadenosine 5'-phosphosulfate sulfotransferase (PAPS reductase)/FAD synthetase
MKELHILNFGAGVQSTALYLMACKGELPIQHAIFADTGNEPEHVYRHLEWCKGLKGPPIHVVRHYETSLGDNLVHGVGSTGRRAISIPAFLVKPDGNRGMGRRQCSEEYKIKPIGRFIRRTLLRLQARARWPDDVLLHQYFGISLDEAGRALRIRVNINQSYVHCEFPLLDRLWSRKECLQYLAAWPVPHPVWKSACTFCPYHSDAEWRKIRDNEPESWAYSVELDRKLREPGTVYANAMTSTMYLHRSCVPLDQVQLDGDPAQPGLPGFSNECMGVCGV